MGDHHHHNNHRNSTSNYNNSHSNRHSHQHQNRVQSTHTSHSSHTPHNSTPPQNAPKPSRFTQIKEKFTNKFSEKAPTREQIEQLKIKAEHARYDADVKVHQARKAKAERENPTGWRRLFAHQIQPQRPQRAGRVGTRRPNPAKYYGGQGRGPPQMGDSMLIGPGSFSGDNLMFDHSGGQVGDNMLSFQSNGKSVENDMLSFKGNASAFNGGKPKRGKKSESMGMSFGEGAMSMFKF